jgi:hypothetical protein
MSFVWNDICRVFGGLLIHLFIITPLMSFLVCVCCINQILTYTYLKFEIIRRLMISIKFWVKRGVTRLIFSKKKFHPLIRSIRSQVFGKRLINVTWADGADTFLFFSYLGQISKFLIQLTGINTVNCPLSSCRLRFFIINFIN